MGVIRTLSLVAIFSFAPAVYAIVGYDCGATGLNLTTISALDIAECDVANLEPATEQIKVQLLQLAEFDYVDVLQCKVEIDRNIYYCGMHSHNSVVLNGRHEYLLAITQDACKNLHITGFLQLSGNAQIVGLKVNSTETRSVTLAGSIKINGDCSGTQYSDPYGTWDNVVVQASVKVTLISYRAPVKLSSNKILLRSGVQCEVSEGACLDNEGGDTFWTALPVDSCHFNHYDVLYEGLAAKISPTEKEGRPIVYTVTTQETTFALTKVSEANLCGYTLLRTEHPKLFVMEIKRDQTFRIHSRISVDNLDIFTYVNSKLVYVEKHIRTQMTQLYKDIMAQKCALEKQVLKNALSFATIAPEEMAYSLMKGLGYTAFTAGEVIHIVKCIPIECQFRETESCYNELPVIHRNQSLFLQPKSRMLVRTGTPRDCNDLLPVKYKVDGGWYKMQPRPSETKMPNTIQPLSKPTWKYVSPSSLATSGIYSQRDLERLRDHIMFPMEKPSMLNTIARGAMGKDVPHGSISLGRLLDDATIDRIAKNAGEKLWNSFISFGSASAGILGIFLIIRVIKKTIEVLINGYALHSIYGWSLHLLGALWISIAHLLLHLGQRESTGRERPPAENISIEANKEAGAAEEEHQPSPGAPPPSPEPQTRRPLTSQRTVYENLNEYLEQMR